ncbi:patatin-like phospholipase family protein [Chloroflexota bacterium]
MKKVGLALGGGVARGLAHIGVLEVLEREGIPINLIAGTSIGAAIGAIYAATGDATKAERWLFRQSRKKFTSFVDISLPKTGFIKGDKIKVLLASFLGKNIDFSALKIPFACVATDIDTGEEVILNQGSVTDAIRASISIPGIFTLTEHNGRHLVDGGLVNPVPVNVVQQMGADFTIAVNVIPDMHYPIVLKDRDTPQKHHEPNLVHVIVQSIYIGNYAIVRSSLEEADVIIEPRVAHIGAGDFHSASECIRQGELAAQEAVPEIKKKLKIKL